MSRAWANGSTAAWRKLRARVLHRDQYQCQLKLPGICTTTATHVHHLKGKAYGDDPKWLASACAPCNLAVGDPTRRQHDPAPTPRSNW